MRRNEKAAKQEAIIKSLEGGASLSKAAQGAGVAHGTLYLWLQDAVFARRVEVVRNSLITIVESTALSCALKAEDDAAYQTSLIFWLKANAGWKETQVVETIGDLQDERRDIFERISRLVQRDGAG